MVVVVSVVIAIPIIFIFLFPLRKLLAEPGKKMSAMLVCIILVFLRFFFFSPLLM